MSQADGAGGWLLNMVAGLEAGLRGRAIGVRVVGVGVSGRLVDYGLLGDDLI